MVTTLKSCAKTFYPRTHRKETSYAGFSFGALSKVFKRVIRKIGQDLSTPDFRVTLYPQTKAKETRPGSAYNFKINVETPDGVSEEATRQINKKDWQKMIIEKMCEYYPDAREVEGGVYIPEIRATISVPDTIFLE